MAKIGAVVVTYNRLSYLKICLQRIQAQTYQHMDVLVVDNNSTDGTQQFLSNVDVLQQRLDENTGPAGGFHEGIKYFIDAGGYDYLWLMDDDVFPAKHCLEELLKAAEVNKLMYPSIRNRNCKTLKYPGWSGFLLPVETAIKAGLPKKELFFWIEDTEYIKFRIETRLKNKIIWVDKAKVVHFASSKRNRKPWGYYYETRNTLYFRIYVQDGQILRRAKATTISCIRLLASSLLSREPKNIKYFCKGLVDGLMGKIGKTVEPIQL